ncbi:MAG: hypothetical protein AAGG44_17710, partial [Planctomycetota bacterium]
MPFDSNPYSPPKTQNGPAGPFFRWRLIPTVLMAMLGLLSFGMGTYFAASVAHEISTDGMTPFVW